MIFRLLGGYVSVMLICDLGEKQMKALQPLWAATHWFIFLNTVFSWVSTLYRVATEDHLTIDSLVDDLFFEEPTSHLLLWGGLAIFCVIDRIMTGKFTILPWNRSLIKQRD